jgi:glucose-1-phosphatase
MQKLLEKPKAVVFDLGKVLLDFDYGKLARNMEEHCDISKEELRSALDHSELLYRYETGLLTSQGFFEEVKRLSNFRRDYERFECIFADIFTPMPEMIDLQRRLQGRDVPTYIFSNTNEIAVSHIRRSYPFFSNFSGYVFSYEHGAMKPDPRIYSVVEEMTGRSGSELLYIDDRVENIEQGKNRGWQVIHQVETEQTIQRVEALLG